MVCLLVVSPQSVTAQTPSQMEYERQQREYWRQQEQQRQEQQRQQQLMNENARRQQEESSRLNAPAVKVRRPPIRALHRSRAARQGPPVDVAAERCNGGVGTDRDHNQRRVRLLRRPLHDSEVREFGEDVGDD